MWLRAEDRVPEVALASTDEGIRRQPRTNDVFTTMRDGSPCAPFEKGGSKARIAICGGFALRAKSKSPVARFAGARPLLQRGHLVACRVVPNQYAPTLILRCITTRNGMGNPSMRSRATISASSGPHCDEGISTKPRAA